MRKVTEKTSVTAPNAETPTSATPPDTLPTPLVMSPACSLSVSSEPLPPLMSSPSSLCLTLSTICGRSSPKSRTASLIACASTRTTAPTTITIASTSTTAHSLRLQRNRRSITLTTGTSTAALKIETKITSRTFAIDASAHGDGDGAGDQQDRLDRYRDLDAGDRSGPARSLHVIARPDWRTPG